ncbi:MAG: sigma-70 family RNA polymerase sigma factor [Cyclobacteriaceae bacterium]
MNTDINSTIEATTETREELITRLYETCFPRVARFIRKQGGTLEDAKDLVQDGMVIYYEQVVKGNTAIQSDESQYLVGIVKHLWSRRFNEIKNLEPLPPGVIALENEKQIDPSFKALSKFLRQSGQKCMALLQAFYYDKISMDQMAEKFGFASARSATVQKYKCLEKIRDNIKKNLMSYEDFFE